MSDSINNGGYDENFPLGSIKEEECLENEEPLINDDIDTKEESCETSNEDVHVTADDMDGEAGPIVRRDFGTESSVDHEETSPLRTDDSCFSSNTASTADTQPDDQTSQASWNDAGLDLEIDTTHMQDGGTRLSASDHEDDIDGVNGVCLDEQSDNKDDIDNKASLISIITTEGHDDIGESAGESQFRPLLISDDSFDKALYEVRCDEMQFLDYVIFSFEEEIRDFNETNLDQYAVNDVENDEDEVIETSTHEDSRSISVLSTYSTPSTNGDLSDDGSSYYRRSTSLSGNKNTFPINSDIVITLMYSEPKRNILGSIRSKKGLNGKENITSPQSVRFHMALLPQFKYRLKTKWVPASSKTLAWNFSIGTFPEEFDTQKKNIRFRLYGKSKSAVSRCYGECFILLTEVVDAENTTVEFHESLLPKGTLKNMNVRCRKNSRKF